MNSLVRCTHDYSYWASKYLEKFGNKALESVLLPDLVHDSEEDFIEMVREFKEALKTGVPIESISEELRGKINR